MSHNKKINEPVETTWITESRDFFSSVMNNTLENLSKNLSYTEIMALAKSETVWMEKYEPSQRQPESPACPKPEPKPRAPRKRAQRKPTKKQKATEEQYGDVNTFDDNEQINYRVFVPPLRPHWKRRSFDLKLAAYVCKRDLIAPLINWELLDRIMVVPEDEGTVAFQSHIDKNLQKSKEST